MVTFSTIPFFSKSSSLVLTLLRKATGLSTWRVLHWLGISNMAQPFKHVTVISQIWSLVRRLFLTLWIDSSGSNSTLRSSNCSQVSADSRDLLVLLTTWNLRSLRLPFLSTLRVTSSTGNIKVPSNSLSCELDLRKAGSPFWSNWTTHLWLITLQVAPVSNWHTSCSLYFWSTINVKLDVNCLPLPLIAVIIRFGYNAHCHWLKERALWEYRA